MQHVALTKQLFAALFAQNCPAIDPADPILVSGPPSSSGTRDVLKELVLEAGCKSNADMVALKDAVLAPSEGGAFRSARLARVDGLIGPKYPKPAQQERDWRDHNNRPHNIAV